MILYTGFQEISGFKISTERLVAILSTSNELFHSEIREASTIVSKRIEYLGIITENYMTFLEEIKEDLNK